MNNLSLKKRYEIEDAAQNMIRQEGDNTIALANIQGMKDLIHIMTNHNPKGNAETLLNNLQYLIDRHSK